MCVTFVCPLLVLKGCAKCLTFGWGPMRFFAASAMCTCVSPKLGGLEIGHWKVELLFGGVHKHPHVVGCLRVNVLWKALRLHFEYMWPFTGHWGDTAHARHED